MGPGGAGSGPGPRSTGRTFQFLQLRRPSQRRPPDGLLGAMVLHLSGSRTRMGGPLSRGRNGKPPDRRVGDRSGASRQKRTAADNAGDGLRSGRKMKSVRSCYPQVRRRRRPPIRPATPRPASRNLRATHPNITVCITLTPFLRRFRASNLQIQNIDSARSVPSCAVHPESAARAQRSQKNRRLYSPLACRPRTKDRRPGHPP